MNTSSFSSLRRLATLATFAACLPLAACNGQVAFGGGDGTGGAGGGPDESSVGGSDPGNCGDDCVTSGTPDPSGGGVGTANAIAMLRSQLPQLDDGGGTTASTGGGEPPPDPDTLEVFIGGQPLACSDPYALSCGSQWTVSFSLPPALQAPGLYALDATELNAFATETGPGGGEECWWGGGSYWDGTVEVLSIDATQVTVRLAGTSGLFEFDADGDFTALRCP